MVSNVCMRLYYNGSMFFELQVISLRTFLSLLWHEGAMT
jgi:hypothetical protein